MTDAVFQGMLDNINNQVAAQQADAITALAAQIQAAEQGTETDDQIKADIATATNQLIAQDIAAASPAYIQQLIVNAEIPAPSATIVINIWTY
jgi:hypothetical protein